MAHLIRAGEAQAAATMTVHVLGTIKMADTIPDAILTYKEVYRAMFGREPWSTAIQPDPAKPVIPASIGHSIHARCLPCG
jgi:hypothetical protein